MPQQHSQQNDAKVEHTTSPQLSNKLKDSSLLQQQQQYNNYPVRHSPGTLHKNLADRTSSPISSPVQRFTPSTTRFSSQDLVNGLTQPNYNNNNSNNNASNSSGGNELPTLPPLNTSSPHLMNNNNSSNNSSSNRSRWTPEEDSMVRPSLNNMTPTPTPQQQQTRQADPSVLIQYQSIPSRDERQLMSPYPQRHPQAQPSPPQQQEVFPNNNNNNSNGTSDVGPYGCGVPNCFASFSASNSLFYHVKNTHTNTEDVIKPYRCAMPSCLKRYKNINGLQYHLREAKGSSGHGGIGNPEGSANSEAHANVKPYTCQIPGCKKAYRTANGLRYHQVHGHNMQPQQQQQQMMEVAMQQQPSQLMHPMQAMHNQQQLHAQQQGRPLQQQPQPSQQQQQPQQYRLQREKWMNNNI